MYSVCYAKGEAAANAAVRGAARADVASSTSSVLALVRASGTNVAMAKSVKASHASGGRKRRKPRGEATCHDRENAFLEVQIERCKHLARELSASSPRMQRLSLRGLAWPDQMNFLRPLFTKNGDHCNDNSIPFAVPMATGGIG